MRWHKHRVIKPDRGFKEGPVWRGLQGGTPWVALCTVPLGKNIWDWFAGIWPGGEPTFLVEQPEPVGREEGTEGFCWWSGLRSYCRLCMWTSVMAITWGSGCSLQSAQMWVTYKLNHRALCNTMRNGCKSQQVGTQTPPQICVFHCTYGSGLPSKSNRNVRENRVLKVSSCQDTACRFEGFSPTRV